MARPALTFDCTVCSKPIDRVADEPGGEVYDGEHNAPIVTCAHCGYNVHEHCTAERDMCTTCANNA